MVKLLTWLKPFIPSWMSLLPYLLGGVGLVSLYFYGEHVGYDKAKNKYTQEIAQIHEQDDRVTALAWKAKSDAERVYKQKADEADQSYSDLASKYNLNLLRFKQLQGITRTSNPSSVNNNPTSSNGPSTDPVVSSGPTDQILIPYSDAEICLTNTARLKTVRVWALSLQETPKPLPKPQKSTDTNSSASSPENGSQ